MTIQNMLSSIDSADSQLLNEHRTLMRRAYINAHIATLGPNNWEMRDTAAFDEIDNQLAKLFQASGRNVKASEKSPLPPKPPFNKYDPNSDGMAKELEKSLDKKD